ncbi:hypothetical protein LJR234_001086 [Mesorhizobium amorphae]|uniref:beta family protein n=1 Tax=Mesorhizobium amorphae TaxID=71433 RepID=UPI003ED09F6F
MYVPNLKTSDSEIRAIRFLSEPVKGGILPAFELTRSRKTSKLPNGSVAVRMGQLVDAYKSDKFILDLSTEEDLINDEIYKFFDEKNGYANWRRFIESFTQGGIVPCALYEEGGSKADFQRQAAGLLSTSGKIALRLSANDENASKLYNWLVEVSGTDKIVLIGNLYFIGQNEIAKYRGFASSFIDSVVGNQSPSMVALPLSSFPRSVVENGYGEDSEGEFESAEYDFFEDVKGRYPSVPLVFSDFASVHPIRYPTRGGAWVPRVDLPVGNEMVYRRYRRDDGGYVQAAAELKRQYDKELIPCWATDQIRAAANGTPGGLSPSYWISVRINYWISKVSSEFI